MYIVVWRRNNDFCFYGPFESRKMAQSFAEEMDPHFTLGWTYSIRILEKPEVINGTRA